MTPATRIRPPIVHRLQALPSSSVPDRSGSFVSYQGIRDNAGGDRRVADMRHASMNTTMAYYVGEDAEATADALWAGLVTL